MPVCRLRCRHLYGLHIVAGRLRRRLLSGGDGGSVQLPEVLSWVSGKIEDDKVSLLLQETVSESVYDKHRLPYRPFQTRLPPVSRQSARQRHIWRDALQAQGKITFSLRRPTGAGSDAAPSMSLVNSTSLDVALLYFCGCHGLFRRRFRRSVRPVQMRFHQHIRQDAPLSVAFGRSRHGHTFVYGHTVGVRPRGGRLHAHVRRGLVSNYPWRETLRSSPRHTHRRSVRFR